MRVLVPYDADLTANWWSLDATEIIGPRKYTFPHYKLFVEQMKKKAAWLQKELGNDDDAEEGETFWTPQRVQLCLYAAAHDQQPSESAKKAEQVKKPKPSSAPKRKAAVKPRESEQDEEDKDTAEQGLRRSQRKRTRTY